MSEPDLFVVDVAGTDEATVMAFEDDAAQVDHKGLTTSTNRLPALSDRLLRSGADRHCSRLLVSAAGVSQSRRA
ncbi:DUF6207 family protein [Streptomyces sp. NBC_00687]|uniref:DUF6207 family protein n=1 Tax=Streptomyces sp. NBC_00687 TaxID=2975807 RepID=UPI00338FD5A4